MLKTGMIRQTLQTCLYVLIMAGAPFAIADTTPKAPQHDFMINNSPLKAGELRAAFEGQTHVGVYRFEREALPTHNFSETTFKDGRVEHVQGDEVLSGQWRVTSDQMCYSYDDVWYNNLCFDMYRVGNCYYHCLMTEGDRVMRVWTAKSWLKGERPNCEPNIS